MTAEPPIPRRSPHPALDQLHKAAAERGLDVGLLPSGKHWILRLSSHGVVVKSLKVSSLRVVDVAAFSLLKWLTNPPEKEAIR